MESTALSQPAEDTSLLPDGRLSHDESNLAEFPLVLLTKRPPEGKHTIEYKDYDLHPRTGTPVLRKVTITGAGKLGLPTVRDEEVLMALIYVTLESGVTDRTVRFNRRKLCEVLGWPDTGHYYGRLKESIRRWKGVNIFYENWWDHAANEYVPEIGFNFIDNYRFYDSRRNDQSQLDLPLEYDKPQRSLSWIQWNKTIYDNFKNGYLTTFDLDHFFSLPTAAAKRAYRYLNLRLPASGPQDFDLKTFACEHVGFSPNYKPSRLLSEVQQAIVSPLEKTQFIELMPSKSRFVKQNGHDRIVFARKAVAALPPADTELAATTDANTAPSPLTHELTRRRLSGKLAKKFVAEHPADYIEQKIDYLDFTLLTETVKNPGGWLRTAIEEDWAPPADYLPRAERERQAEAQQQAKDDRRQKQLDANRQQERRHRADAYWSNLTPAAQAELEAQVLAAACDSTRDAYLSLKRQGLGEGMLAGLRREYILTRLDLEQTAEGESRTTL